MNLYSEPLDAGNRHRQEYFNELNALIQRWQNEAAGRRGEFFKPDFSSPAAFSLSTDAYRQQYKAMLGFPLDQPPTGAVPPYREVFVAEDDLGKIYRIWIETLPGLHSYGLLFLPPAAGAHPLVFSLHGGLGTPELTSGFFGSANYNDMTRRVLRRGCAVYAPQLLIWSSHMFGPNYNRDQINIQLLHLGGSLVALEVWNMMAALTCLSAHPSIDGSRAAIMGLSYGGYYSLFTAAADTRFKAALLSCSFTPMERWSSAESLWFNSANRFMSTEMAALICPRRLYIEAGKTDDLVPADVIRPEAQKVAEIYQRLGIAGDFRYKEHGGWHEFDTADDGIDFLCNNL